MPRIAQKSRHNNKRKHRQRDFARSPPKVSDEAISIYIKNLPASADKQSIHNWCRRTLYNGLGADDQHGDREEIIDDIWIAKPVAVRSGQTDENVDGTTQKLRYAHVRFQHVIFKRLMVAHAKPAEYDGISKPEIQKWKSKTTRHSERKLVRAAVESKEAAPVEPSGEGSSSLSQPIDGVVA